MLPILLSLGPIQIFSLSVFLLLSWCAYSFVFWSQMREQGVEEEKIFDITFYSTITALVAARLGYVLFHWEVFDGHLLRIAALWVAPGLSFYGGLVGGLLTTIVVARALKVRLSYIFDSIAFALPVSMLFGVIGVLFDGTVIGHITELPWAISYVGYAEFRHPVQLYQFIGYLLILGMMYVVKSLSFKQKLAYGQLGILFFLLFAVLQFVVEFFIVSSIYWWLLSPNQWILLALFSESIGVWYVVGGGSEWIMPRVKLMMKGAYERVSRRFVRNH